MPLDSKKDKYILGNLSLSEFASVLHVHGVVVLTKHFLYSSFSLVELSNKLCQNLELVS